MTLIYMGDSVRTENGVSLRAKDSISGRTVAVKASDEVLRDFGLPKVQAMGQTKFDAGKIQEDGCVSVSTSDFNA
jgi:hypothetical protein